MSINQNIYTSEWDRKQLDAFFALGLWPRSIERIELFPSVSGLIFWHIYIDNGIFGAGFLIHELLSIYLI